MTGRLGIDDVTPSVGDGRHPSKAVVGEVIPIGATVWREGHDAVAANVVWRKVGSRAPAHHVRMEQTGLGTDRFEAVVAADEQGLWTFRVDAWSDPWATWRNAVTKKLDAGQTPEELANDLEIGARLLQRVGRRPAERPNRDLLFGAANALRDTALPLHARVAPALFPAVHAIMTERPVRELITRGRSLQVYVDRVRAQFGSWYEFFPRSTGGRDETGRAVHGTFVTAAKELDRVAAMDFDVVYLPPIHPVGTVHRKGRNNSVHAGPGDVGSPWAIGSAEGGHDAIDPELGTMEDFDAFVARTNDLGMEVALDFALQCAPDHPWVKEHPEWFTVRPDGTIAYAENPPKKYQDIYPVNFDNDPEGIYNEVLRVVLLWVEHGVRIFRVDNPHTKPPNFWHWLIWQVKARYPDVLFLAEAFTRPARLFGLARLGFTQSYSYFTWRTEKAELTEFALMHAERCDEARPNLFVNTPDILHESLQHGGRGMFAIRAALAVHDGAHVGRVLGLRAVRGRGRQARLRGVPELGEVRAAPARLRGRRGHRQLAGALHHAAQRDPPRAPGAAAAAQHRVPPGQQRPDHLLLQDRPGHRRHRAHGDHPRPVERAGGHHRARPARPRAQLGRGLHGARRDHRRHLAVGPVQLRAAGALAPRGAHLPHRA